MKVISVIFLVILLLIIGSAWGVAPGFMECASTMNDVEGPYYVAGAPFRTHIAGPDEQGDRLVIEGYVRGSDCKTVIRGALIEVWQTDTNGEYYYRAEGYRLRGQLKTDETGTYRFHTIKPGRYKLMTGFRPAHIHLKISHPDFETVTTQLYFQGDPYLWPEDACGRGCKSNDPMRIISLDSNEGMLHGTFDIILDPTSLKKEEE